MRLVIIESPFNGPDHETIRQNVHYARRCMKHCLSIGEAPYASHLLYTQSGVLDDRIEQERTLGIDAGLAWGKLAEATVVYTDRGISPGMKLGIKHAEDHGRPVEYRTLPVPEEEDRG